MGRKESNQTNYHCGGGGGTGICSWTSFILVYINDIAEYLLSLTRLFADDSSLFCSAAHINDIAGIINHDMQLLSNWAKQWLVTFNPLKTEAVLFTLKKINILPQLFLIIFQFILVDSHKHLVLPSVVKDNGTHILKSLSYQRLRLWE